MGWLPDRLANVRKGVVSGQAAFKCLLDLRMVGFQGLRQLLRRSTFGVESGLRAREQSRPLGEDRFPQKSSHGVSGR